MLGVCFSWRMSKLSVCFFVRKSIIDCFQDETENYIPRKVIGSFISIKKCKVKKHRTRCTNEYESKEARGFFVLSDWVNFHAHARKKVNFADQISQTKTNINMNKNYLHE